MPARSKFFPNLIFLILLFLILFLLHPNTTGEEKVSETINILTPSIFVNDSALFHPLLRQGTFRPLRDVRLDSLSAYLVVNAGSGEVYAAKDATKRIAPASFVKLMTAMVALDVASPSAKLMASGRASLEEPTALGVKPGEVFSIGELVPAMIATSANDAATIIGEEVLREYGGNEEVFVALMNKKAAALGLGDTRFANVQGFDDEDQFSNAYDLSRIAHYAYENYPLVRRAAATAYSTIEDSPEHGFYHLPNWNALLGTYPGVDGLKIGYTENAGYSTIVTATQGGTSLIVVISGAQSVIERDLSAATLLNHAFSQANLPGVHVSEDLIAPRLDEWRKLREQILQDLEREEDEYPDLDRRSLIINH